MEKKKLITKNNLIFHTQYIKDLSFENPNSPDFHMNNNLKPEVKINVNVETKNLKDKYHELTLNLLGNVSSDNKNLFIIELSFSGLFSFIKKQENNEKELFIEGAKLLFPFARAIISNITRDGGYSPLYINPINFEEIYDKRKS